MSHSESEPDSKFVINSISTFVPIFSESKSESESEFTSVFLNLDICVFLPYIYTLLNKLADDFFINIHNRINSYASNNKYNVYFLLAYHYPKILFLSHDQILLL